MRYRTVILVAAINQSDCDFRRQQSYAILSDIPADYTAYYALYANNLGAGNQMGGCLD